MRFVQPTGTTIACSRAMPTTNPTPISELVELHYQPLFRFAMRLCQSPARAMVLTQRTFGLARDRSRALPVPGNVQAWLFALLLHNFLESRPRLSGA